MELYFSSSIDDLIYIRPDLVCELFDLWLVCEVSVRLCVIFIKIPSKEKKQQEALRALVKCGILFLANFMIMVPFMVTMVTQRNLNYVFSSVWDKTFCVFIAVKLRFSEKWRQSWTLEIVYMVFVWNLIISVPLYLFLYPVLSDNSEQY